MIIISLPRNYFHLFIYCCAEVHSLLMLYYISFDHVIKSFVFVF